MREETEGGRVEKEIFLFTLSFLLLLTLFVKTLCYVSYILLKFFC